MTRDEIEAAVKLAGERIDAWIAKLRDPAAKQTRGVLRSDDGQCCLGVLCDVAGLEYRKLGEPGSYEYVGPVAGGTYQTEPPKCVAHSVGLSTSGNLEGGWEGVPDAAFGDVSEDYQNLVYLNDDTRWSFRQIADLIEKNKDRMIERVRYHAERKFEA